MTEREWLYAFDLKERDVDVRISRVSPGVVKGVGGKKDKKPVVWFEGQEKPLALNATNCKAISAIVGSPDTDRWPGAWITIYPTTCAAASGEMVDCIRIRPKAPQRASGSGGARGGQRPSGGAQSELVDPMGQP